MCSTCASPSLTRGRRTGLADIAPARHCAIVGTCLSLAELKSVAAKFPAYARETASDYEIHATIVHMIARDRKLAKVLTRTLDRKHALAIARAAKAADESALLDLWRDAVARGEPGGALWAILSHASAGEVFRQRITGEMHMLSHHGAAAQRGETRSAHAQAETNRALRHELDALRARQATQQTAHNAALAALRQNLEEETRRADRLSHAAADADRIEADRLRIDVLEGEAAALRAADAEARNQLRTLTAACQTLERENARLAAESAQYRDEARAADERLAALLPCGDSRAGCDGRCRGLDLCGRCILFVGGRNQHLPHLRRLVEESNGTFAHHDGGLEESLGLLPVLVHRADAVLFSVDNVSHAAQDELKRRCRHQARPFLPVRRSGLGAYLSALHALAEMPSADGSAVTG